MTEKKISTRFERPVLVPIEGVPVQSNFAANWDRVKVFQAQPDDLLIATYTKAGTTWISEIVDMINNNGDTEICRRGPTHERVPYLEFGGPNPLPIGIEQAINMPSPRIIKTHFPYQLVPKSFWEQDCKVIYVARNAKDNAVSLYHFNRMTCLQVFSGTWEEHLENFMKGNLSFGSWYDHVRNWWENKDRHRMLYMFYEDMKKVLSQTGRITSLWPKMRGLMRIIKRRCREPLLNLYLSSEREQRIQDLENAIVPSKLTNQVCFS
ncbi:sulfotransferase 1 family member D1-like isoform X4 [Protopterus annectens]|uniref:sulfotransferase 1 family member D1-like isoform X4 n=1 Tax=Protopterus annectens TaxID=7888 RepID=UPI001CFAC68C|nr:sulfotransferase 1 family member D1-like isoform X4 [Protopterus annectens]